MISDSKRPRPASRRANGLRALGLLAAASIALTAAGCASSTRSRRAMAMAEAMPPQAAPTASANASPDTAGAPPSTAPLLDRATYRLTPGDLIDIKFPYHPEENERVSVRPDGHIQLQTAGTVFVAGRTIGEVEAEIVDKSSANLRDPVVTVVVVQRAEHKVYVAGDVAKPGFVLYRDGLTPLEAIIERGGFLDTAKTDDVLYITRSDGTVRTERLDLEAVIDGDTHEQVVMGPNDILFVPKTWIGDANVWVDQWIRGLLPTVPRPGFDLNAVAF